MREKGQFESRAEALRLEFDRSFTLPLARAFEEQEDLLSVRVGRDPYVVRLSEVLAVVGGRAVIPVPSAHPELLGVAGIRGDIFPVFSLASLLGYALEAESPEWLLVSKGAEPLAFSVSELEGYVRSRTSDMGTPEQASQAQPFVRGIVRTEGAPRSVIALSLVVSSIQDRHGRSGPKKEQ